MWSAGGQLSECAKDEPVMQVGVTVWDSGRSRSRLVGRHTAR